jgi:hypothetical protein
MNPKFLMELLKHGAKAAASAGAVSVLTKVASKIPGPVGAAAKGVVFAACIVAPMIKRK